jgi:hypothetical protein
MVETAITLVLNFLLIPTMSYYGSNIATNCRLWKHDDNFLLPGKPNVHTLYDLEENRRVSLAIDTWRIFTDLENYYVESGFINRVPIFYHNEK